MEWTRFESSGYWIVFTATFLAIALWESRRPERSWIVPAERRWTMHGLLMLIVAVLDTLVFRISTVAAAVLAQDNPWGILSWSGIPFAVRAAAGFLVLDLMKYGTHWMFHHVPFLWPVHRVHHSDPDFDVSTGARFHPIEPLIVIGAEMIAIMLLSPPPLAVLVSKLTSVFFNFWEHANAALPGPVDRGLRCLVMTPTAHRIHHGQGLAEQNSNLGQVFSWWDRIFGTYREGGTKGLVLGLKGYQTAQSLELGEMLLQPFRKERPADE